MTRKNGRFCIGCNKIKPIEELLRITKTTKGDIEINTEKKFFGRSAYVCYNMECLNNSFKKNKIFKFLRKNFEEEYSKKIKTVLTEHIMVKINSKQLEK